MIRKYLNNMEFDKHTLIAYLRFLIGGYFIYASLDKIADPHSFARVIESYHFSSSIGLSFLDTFLALILPWLELFLGIFIILGIFIDEAINIVILLLLFFLVMLFGAYFQGLDISCGCTSDNGSSLEDAIIKDFILLFACLYIKFRGFIRNRYV
tara:strand:+ start:596 stop:1057 length:462 start_codon:yes stop_codon:yes gene_type:complete